MDVILDVGDWTYFVELEWKRLYINDFKTKYKVSNIGQVMNWETGNILSGETDKDGYKRILLDVNGKWKHFYIHRLVAMMFIFNDDPEHKTQVNHINGIKDDNRVENLEWCTCQENIKHAWKTGLKHAIKGSDNVLSKYTDAQINMVCKLLAMGMPNKIIALVTKVPRKYITDIKKGHRWRHVAEKYLKL